MTRIIAGAARGLTLKVPASGTRPTSDRVRESLFGALEAGDLLDGMRVLDLYAGSGALGLEAASRGARAVDLVERAHHAIQAAQANAQVIAKATGVRAHVHGTGVAPFLRSSTGTWDLVFADPPYDVGDAELDEVLTLLAPRLEADAVVIVERAKRSSAPNWRAGGLEALRDKTFGDTTLWWGQPSASSQS